MKSSTAKFLFSAALSLASFVYCGQSSDASILYSSVPSGGLSADYSSNAGAYQVAVPFMVSTSGTVTNISVWGYSGISNNLSFKLEFFNEDTTNPGNPLTPSFYSSTTATTAGTATGIYNANSQQIYRWDFSVTNQALGNATQYFFSAKALGSNAWVWSQSAVSTDTIFVRFNDTEDWQGTGSGFSNAGKLGFQLEENLPPPPPPAVPEPASIAIWGLALAFGLTRVYQMKRSIA